MSREQRKLQMYLETIQKMEEREKKKKIDQSAKKSRLPSALTDSSEALTEGINETSSSNSPLNRKRKIPKKPFQVMARYRF